MVVLAFVTLAATVISGVLAAPKAGPEPDGPDFDIGPHNLARRQGGMDYNQNYRTSGNVNFQPSNNGYSVSFSGAGDFVVGKGWRTGRARNISFEGQTQQTSGTVLVSIYGWTKNPLIEYYVQEYTSNGAGSAQGQKLGSFQVDGSTYDVWKHQQVNQPSIQGTATFWQYISNRVNKRPGSGTVNMQAHFDAWKKFGLNLGSHDYQVLATEGWGNAGGNSKYTLSEANGGGGGGGGGQPQPQPSSSRPPMVTTSVKTLTSATTSTKTVTATVTSATTSVITKTETAPAVTKTETAPAVTKTETSVRTESAPAVTVTQTKTETVVKTEMVAKIETFMTTTTTVGSCAASAAMPAAPTAT